MQTNRINNNQSFGMAFNIDAKSFLKADRQETEKVAGIVKQIGKTNLDKVSALVDCDFFAAVKNGKIETVTVAALPKDNRNALSILFDVFIHSATNTKNKVSYIKDIKMKDLTPTKLLTTVEDTSKNSVDKFGSTEVVKSIFED